MAGRRAGYCVDCARVSRITTPWLRSSRADSDIDWLGWAHHWGAVADALCAGPAHVILLQTVESPVSLGLSAGYGRVRLTLDSHELLSEGVARKLSEFGMLPVSADGQTWARFGSEHEVLDFAHQAAWCAGEFVVADTNEEVLIQIVQLDRSCAKCWEVVPQWPHLPP